MCRGGEVSEKSKFRIRSKLDQTQALCLVLTAMLLLVFGIERFQFKGERQSPGGWARQMILYFD